MFDKGYNDYKAFKLFTDNETGFVTRLKDNAKFEINEEKIISDRIHSGVLLDTILNSLLEIFPNRLKQIGYYEVYKKQRE